MGNSSGPGEIAEHVVAGAVPARSPFDRVAGIAHPSAAAHARLEVRHLERDMIERRRLGRAHHHRRMVGVVAVEEVQRPAVIDLAKAQHVDQKGVALLNLRCVEIDVRDLARPVRASAVSL